MCTQHSLREVWPILSFLNSFAKSKFYVTWAQRAGCTKYYVCKFRCSKNFSFNIYILINAHFHPINSFIFLLPDAFSWWQISVVVIRFIVICYCTAQAGQRRKKDKFSLPFFGGNIRLKLRNASTLTSPVKRNIMVSQCLYCYIFYECVATLFCACDDIIIIARR